MRALGKLPNDPLFKDLNDIQLHWCYLNIIKDREEEEELWKNRLNYMGLYINPDLVKELANVDSSRSYNGENGYTEQPIYHNDDFAQELQNAISNGGSEDASTKEQFMEIPNGHYGDSSMSSNEFIDFVNNNIDAMGDLQQKIDSENGNLNPDIDIIEINE